MTHDLHASMWEAEAEAGTSLEVCGPPGLQELVPIQTPKLQRNLVLRKQNKQTKKNTLSTTQRPFVIIQNSNVET